MIRKLKFFFIVIPAINLLAGSDLIGQRISVSGNHFQVDGSEIFINGVNTPWDHWNDFGGNYEHGFWYEEFRKIRQNGGNASRIWITCNGDIGVNITDDGEITGVTDAHWEDLDDMFELARQHHIYIMATLISFDHTKNSHAKYLAWRKMFADTVNVGSYIGHYLIPFLNRYKDNPYLWSIDACNEIEWMHENDDNGLIPWTQLQYFVARVASAVHQNSSILVTLGSAAVKWNSGCSGCEGNLWRDESLQLQYNSTDAFLDFYSPHFYGWVVRWFGNFAQDKTPASYGLTDRPVMVGENPATGVYEQNASGTDDLIVPIADAYLKTYDNDWRGLMVWTSNGVDQNGSLEDCGEGLFNFFKTYPYLVDPTITGLEEYRPGFSDVNVFPNPITGIFYIKNSCDQKYKIELFDLTGKKLLNNNYYGPGIQLIDVSHCRSGLYILKYSSAGKTFKIKLIKN